ncbi:MAG: pentapeptide repeat-containing protein [Gammaproteobacteria bacterium]|nr:pentapeptide repeat-containing protein [Gammaproteobacteria bacterium]
MIEEFFTPKFLSSIFERIKSFVKERDEETIKIGDIFGDPVELSKFYIEPNCQNINPANEDEEESLPFVTSPAFKVVNKFLNGDLQNIDDGRNIMFVLADAGMGKTSLLMMLKLSHITSLWPKKYNCTLLKMDDDTLDTIKNMENKSITILLLDALDEDPYAYGRVKERLTEILDEAHRFRRVILTCRTQFFPADEIEPYKRVGKIKIGAYFCPMFFLSLFDDEQVEEYLNKRFTSPKERKSAKKIVTDMGSLKCRPLLLVHIDGFLDTSIRDLNEYKIYEILIDTWLTREERKIRSLKITKDMLMKACTKIAYLMHKQVGDVRILSEEKFTYYVREDYSELKNISDINLGGRSLLNRNSDGDYRFSHYSIQEFILAKGILSGVITEHESVRFSSLIFRFLEKNNPEKIIFRELNYEGANLSGKILNNRDFSNINMKKVNFSGARLMNCKFENTSLTESVFERAILTDSDMSGADISNASFNYADVTGVLFRGCNADGAEFHESITANAVLPIPIAFGT